MSKRKKDSCGRESISNKPKNCKDNGDWVYRLAKTNNFILRAKRQETEAMRLSIGASTSKSIAINDELDERYSSENNLESDETDDGSSEGKEEI